MDTSFLHNHPAKEQMYLPPNQQEEHVIVDRQDWEIILQHLKMNPQIAKHLTEFRSIRFQGPSNPAAFKIDASSAFDLKAKTLNEQFERLAHQYEDQLNIEVGEYIGSNTKNPQAAVNKVIIRNLARLMASLAK